MNTVISLTIQGSVFIAVILAVRALTARRLPKATFVLLWGIAAARLLIPYTPESMLSILNLAARFQPQSGKQTVLKLFLPAAQDAASASGSSVAPGILFWVWLGGCVLLTAVLACSYLRSRRLFQTALPLAEPETAEAWLKSHPIRRRVSIRTSDRIASPLTYGVLRPVILLPKQLDLSDTAALHCILEHEWEHIRRFDCVWKIFFTAALCVHWFNPLVWLFVLFANRDLELSCDEQAVLRIGRSRRSTYALTLIHMEEKKAGLSPLLSGFSRNFISERVESIMKLQKKSAIATIAAVMLVIGTTAVFATTSSNSQLVPDTNGDNAPQINLTTKNNGETMNREQFNSWIDEQKVTLAADVKNGTLTQAEADEQIKAYQDMASSMREGSTISLIKGEESSGGGLAVLMTTEAAADGTPPNKESYDSLIDSSAKISKSISTDSDYSELVAVD